ncbi:MAG TPA: nuclear transport factor 2 family protein [Thermoleophilaceae bacterium]|jgi:hypothetical protein
MSIEAYREAASAGDIEGVSEQLAEDVVLHSPVVFHPFEGRPLATEVLRAVFDVFEDFRFTDHVAGDDLHTLVFRARVGDRELEGVDVLRPDADGKIATFTVMIRPFTGLQAFMEAMGPRIEAIAGGQAAPAG